jgi:hypothetical protein
MKKSLAFAWLATKHVKSNAIVLVQGTSTVGVGTGQPNRVDSVWLAAKRAGERAKNSVLVRLIHPFPFNLAASINCSKLFRALTRSSRSLTALKPLLSPASLLLFNLVAL